MVEEEEARTVAERKKKVRKTLELLKYDGDVVIHSPE